MDIAQRGGRCARQAQLELRSLCVELQPPASRSAGAAPLIVNVVLAQEIAPPPDEDALRWVLLTSEPVGTTDQAAQVIRYYELRWRIEEYHKAWKSGVGVERQRFQSAENLERMLVITAFLAVRLLQLREHLQPAPAGDRKVACDVVLTQQEWQVLWLSCEHSPPTHHCTLASVGLHGRRPIRRLRRYQTNRPSRVGHPLERVGTLTAARRGLSTRHAND